MKKSIILKLLGSCIAMVLVISSLIGCSPKSGGGQQLTNQTETTPNEKETNIVWWTIGNEPKDYELVSEEINKYTKEKLNINLQMKYVSWGEYSSKLSKIIQSGENYDIAFLSGIDGYQDLMTKGYFADLTDILPTTTPTLYEFLGKDLWQGVTVNNKIYGVPAFKDSAQTQYWIWDKETIENANIDYKNVKTLQDLEPVLRKLKELNPDKYPLILTGPEGINGFMSAINGYDELLVIPSVGISYSDESAKVVGTWEQENVLENLRIINKWFNDGLINPDAATLLEAPKNRPIVSSQSFNYGWKPTEIGTPYFGPAYSTRTIQGSFLGISSSSKNIEASLKLIELVNTDKYFRNLLAFGIENVHYEKTGENTINELNDKYQVPAYSQGTFFNLYVKEPHPETMWEELQQQQATAFSSPALGFTFDTKPVQNQVSACTNIEQKYRNSLLTGSVNPDEVLPKMIEELNKAGYQDIIQEVQKQLNEYLGK